METQLEISEQFKKESSKTALLWLGIVSIVMLFAAFTSAYIVSMGGKGWLEFDLPTVFYTSTLVIVLSSLLMVFAVVAGKNGNQMVSVSLLGLTLFSGIIFVYLQVSGWNALTSQGIYFTGSTSSNSGSYLFILTALHIVHLLAAFIALIITLIRALMNKYSAENYNGLKRCSIYWHFLTILWVYLFLFLEFI